MNVNIEVAGLGRAKRKKRGFERIIGCYDPDIRRNRVIRFHRPKAPAMLVLRFVDLDEPAPAPHDARPELRLPSREQVERAIAFDRPDQRLLVHCQAGISRSSAIALAIIAARLGPEQEEEALRLLMAIRPEAVPNLCVLRHADDILGAHGRLVAAVVAHENDRPHAKLRRQANRQAYLDFYGASEGRG